MPTTRRNRRGGKPRARSRSSREERITIREPKPPNEFHLRVLSVIRQIPEGRISTYGKIAEAAGLPRRARLVGRILRDSPLAADVPWHRVVNAVGRISDRPGKSAGVQHERLTSEGVELSSEGRIDLDAYLWIPTLTVSA